MTRSFFKYFLTLSILVLTGSNLVYADAAQRHIPCSYDEMLQPAGYSSLEVAREDQSLIILAPVEKEIIKVHAREVREEEDQHDFGSVKKKLSAGNALASIFRHKTIGRFFAQTFLYSYRRHLILRVLRL